MNPKKHVSEFSLEMSTLASIENTFRYALGMIISEDFFNVLFPGFPVLIFVQIILRFTLAIF